RRSARRARAYSFRSTCTYTEYVYTVQSSQARPLAIIRSYAAGNGFVINGHTHLTLPRQIAAQFQPKKNAFNSQNKLIIKLPRTIESRSRLPLSPLRFGLPDLVPCAVFFSLREPVRPEPLFRGARAPNGTTAPHYVFF
ncbi:unnamed protein product, partial [Ixodes pacificus]